MDARLAVTQYIKDHPGCTVAEIVAGTGLPRSRVSNLTSTGAGKLYDRTTAGRTLANVPFYAYTIRDVPAQATVRLPRAKRKQPAKIQDEVPAAVISVDAMVSDLAGRLADQLAGAIAAQVAEKLQEQLAARLGSLTPALAAPKAPPVTAEELVARFTKPQDAVERLPKVIIVGLLPAQMGHLVADFGDVYDLRLFTEGSPAALRTMAQGAKAIFLHINHARHSFDEVAKASGVPFVRVSGGMTAMRDALTKLYVEGTV